MLSKNAFNALLKTLEEPPAHVKFLFATTEVNKVPVTVLSRCQRFDLRRIPADMLAEHFGHVAEAEGGRGRARGAGADRPRRRRLGPRRPLDPRPGDRPRRRRGDRRAGARPCSASPTAAPTARLLGLILGGDAPGTLAALRDQYDLGVEPSAVIRGLLEAVHGITRAKVGGRARSGPVGRGARGLCRLGGEARPRRHPPALAIAAQGPRRGPRRADAAGGRRNGAAARHPRRRAARSRRGAREAGERRDRRGARRRSAEGRGAARAAEGAGRLSGPGRRARRRTARRISPSSCTISSAWSATRRPSW